MLYCRIQSLFLSRIITTSSIPTDFPDNTSYSGTLNAYCTFWFCGDTQDNKHLTLNKRSVSLLLISQSNCLTYVFDSFALNLSLILQYNLCLQIQNFTTILFSATTYRHSLILSSPSPSFLPLYCSSQSRLQFAVVYKDRVMIITINISQTPSCFDYQRHSVN